jgi:DNA (cytosine-5)-methyltransferase 1
LKYFPSPPVDSIEEIIALTDPSLSLFTVEEECMSELDQRPILKLTQFGIYDEPGHLCHLDGGAIEANHLLFAYGYVKPVWNDNPGIQGGIATKEIAPINEWFISGFHGGEKAIMCQFRQHK